MSGSACVTYMYVCVCVRAHVMAYVSACVHLCIGSVYVNLDVLEWLCVCTCYACYSVTNNQL